MENLKKAMIIRGGNVIGAVGDKNFSTLHIGCVIPFAGNTDNIPRGYLLADGASYPTADYPDLYAVIGNTYGGDSTNFNVPDYRETVLVGVGENTTDTIADHDVYELGEFKDDQFQDHTHSVTNIMTLGKTEYYDGSQKYLTRTSTTNKANSGRFGTTTHGKQKGVTYIIKAFHTNEGTDSNEVTDQIVEYVEGEIDALISDTTSSTTSTYSSVKIDEKIAKHALPLIYDTGIRGNTGIEIYKLSNVTYEALGGENAYNLNLILSTRAGEEIELFGGKNDAGWLLFARKHSDYSTKILDIHRDGYDVYVRLGTYFNYFRVFHKSGALRSDFAVSMVTSIPDTATEIPITAPGVMDNMTSTESTWSSSKIASTMPTTRSLTLKSGYSGYITETYDPTTKVVVYNVNISGTFKGLLNSIADGFKIPKGSTSSSDVMHKAIGMYGSDSAMTGDAQFTRLLVRNYGNPHLEVDVNAENTVISGTITYVTA